jgi:spore maturation protein CgeB
VVLASLDLRHDPNDALRRLIPSYDLVFTYGGGTPVIEAYRDLGAQRCVPIYNALDPSTHFPVPTDPRFAADLSFLGNRLPDREERVFEYFFKAARKDADLQFVLGGSGWDEITPGYANVNYLGHVYTSDHNALNSTALAVLNVCCESMARYGFSPPTRLFEAAGAGACLITDAWEGVECFLEPERECLLARSGDEVSAQLSALSRERARTIGQAALQRVTAEHTYAPRAAEVENALSTL